MDTQTGTKSFEEATIANGDEYLQGRYFTVRSPMGLIAGTNLCVMCSLNRPPSQTWPVFKDFNIWQREHQYSGVVGDLEGHDLHLTVKPAAAGLTRTLEDTRFRVDYQVTKVIPEHLIVLTQPPSERKIEVFPGLGRVSPGFHAFMLHEQGGKSVLNAVMNHASLMQEAGAVRALSDDEAIDPWRNLLREGLRKWKDEFIPSLKAAVEAL